MTTKTKRSMMPPPPLGQKTATVRAASQTAHPPIDPTAKGATALTMTTPTTTTAVTMRRQLQDRALRTISSEIDFAFRQPAAGEGDTDPDGTDPVQPQQRRLGTPATCPVMASTCPVTADQPLVVTEDEELRTLAATSHSGDYVAALQAASTAGPGGSDVAIGPRSSRQAAAMHRRLQKRLLHEQQDAQRHHERLIEAIDDLEREIARLDAQRRKVCARLRSRQLVTHETLVGIVQTYFAVFRDGFDLPLPEWTLTQRRYDGVDQSAFLRAVMDEDVITCSILTGVEALIEQWRRYALFFRLRDYRLHSMTMTALDDHPIVEIRCSYRVRITFTTIAELFPHIAGDAFFVQQLVGRDLLCDSRVTFAFDDARRITRYDDDSDFVTAFAKVIGRPKELTVLMQGAMIHERAILGDVSEVAPPPPPQSS